MMIRFYLFCVVIFAISLAGPSATAQITYFVLPVELGDYELSGGFITTDGTLGQIGPENIIGYQIDVTGPWGYTFLPTDPGAGFGLTLSATLDELTLDYWHSFSIAARDQTRPECDGACYQRLIWHFPAPDAPGRLNYHYFDRIDRDPDVTREALIDPVVMPGLAPYIVLARVPEPSSFGLCLSAMLAGVAFRLRQKAQSLAIEPWDNTAQ